MTKRSASRSRASSADARSLSTTTSAPTRWFVPGSYIVGMPPPPVQMTTAPFSSSHSTGRISNSWRGSGDATTRRHLSPSGLTVQPFSPARRSASSLEYTGPMNLVGFSNAGSAGSTSTIVRTVASGFSFGRRLPSSCSIRYPIIPSVCAPRTSSGYVSTSRYAAPCSARRPTCGPLPCDTTSSCSSATGASASAATRMFSRWLSAVMGCPRRSSAFPPSATTTRMLGGPSVGHGGHEDRLDRVHAVLGLVEDDRGRGFEDLLGHLHLGDPEMRGEVGADLRVGVVEGREAVHEPGVRVAGGTHRVRVDLVGPHLRDPLGPHLLGLAHRDPDVRVDEVDALHAFGDRVGQRDPSARVPRDPASRLDQLVVRPAGARTDEPDVRAELRAADHERIAHVVRRVAEEGERDLVHRLAGVLLHRQEVGQDLGRVELVREAVP